MGSNRNFSRRENCKAPATVPAVPDLGRLTLPRKTNKAAAKTVASGDVLWDKRKVAGKARKRALETQARRISQLGVHSLSRRQKKWIGNHLSAWSWDASTGALQAPTKATQRQLDELVEVARLPYVQRALVKVQGVSLEQIVYVAERAAKTALFVLVDPVRKSQQTIRVAHVR
ncbi:hypothetical protein [Arthrobacter sp. OAP107]|uniref:hypothetical protein n=1 Tax=Arthrobacter sp. OAP107 TaxID=3156445 RepID=UPI003393ED2E